jgi:glyoxylase-like metal-dependent hydrolase (beta-lactamase superfamily II)
MPSLVPEPGPVADELYFVLCEFGHLGTAYVETDPTGASRDDVVRNFIDGEYRQPLRVTVDVERRTSRDVSGEIAASVLAQADADELSEAPAPSSRRSACRKLAGQGDGSARILVGHMYFNGEGIQLIYEPNAHTDGDVLAWFRGSDVIATGDVFDTTRMPEIDLKRGGHVNGVIEALNRIIDVAISEQFTEGGTRIVPGKGRICDEFDVVEYRDMVTIVRDRVQAMVKKGMTLVQVQGAKPAFEYVPRYGAASATAFVEAAYKNLGGK